MSNLQPEPHSAPARPRTGKGWKYVAGGLAMAAAVGCVTVGLWAQRMASGGWMSFLPPVLRWSSTVTPSGPAVLQSIQSLERLETTRFRSQVVVKGDTGNVLPRWLVGDRMVFIGHGEVVAGLDLGRMAPGDVQVNQQGVTLRLPRPEIFHASLDNRQSEVFSRETGFLTGPDRTLESRVRVQAEDQLREAALQGGVLREAEVAARGSLTRHLTRLGFRKVDFL